MSLTCLPLHPTTAVQAPCSRSSEGLAASRLALGLEHHHQQAWPPVLSVSGHGSVRSTGFGQTPMDPVRLPAG